MDKNPHLGLITPLAVVENLSEIDGTMTHINTASPLRGRHLPIRRSRFFWGGGVPKKSEIPQLPPMTIFMLFGDPSIVKHTKTTLDTVS